jgi:hypothetical protein
LFAVHCDVVSWLCIICRIEDVFTLPRTAGCLVRELAFDAVNWYLSYVRGINLPSSLTSSARSLSRTLTPTDRPQALLKNSKLESKKTSPLMCSFLNRSRSSPSRILGFICWIYPCNLSTSQVSTSSTVGISSLSSSEVVIVTSVPERQINRREKEGKIRCDDRLRKLVRGLLGWL